MLQTPDVQPLRIGLIGCGYVSKYHVASARALGLPITAVCDRKPDAAASIVSMTGAQPFTSPTDLLTSGLVDAAIIATPHLSHVAIACEALEHGLHVLVEKPLAVSAEEAFAALATHRRHSDKVLAINFNQRAWPLWRTIKRLIDDGTLGDITRFQWTIADWYRSQRYYQQSNWRGTWAGEGGGLLVNQCPHQLDLLSWFFGRPSRVFASVRFGKHHQIAVEDEVQALLDYPDGMSGCLIASTGEPLGPNRLEIIGDRGQLHVLSDTALELTTYAIPLRQHTQTSLDRSAPPSHTTRRIEVESHDDEYRLVLANFADACAGRTKLITPPEDALASIELANAILMSGCTGRAVHLPIDHTEFNTLLTRLQATPTIAAPSAGGAH